MKPFKAIAAAAVIGTSLIGASPAQATSADYWAQQYKSRLISRVYDMCDIGREFNDQGRNFQRVRIQYMREEIRKYPAGAQDIRAQTAGMTMAMSDICPGV